MSEGSAAELLATSRSKLHRRTVRALGVIIAMLVLIIGMIAVDDTAAPPTPPAGFPDEANTGPAGDLVPSAGISTTVDGQIIEHLDVDGDIRVNHSNVVIRNVAVHGLIDINPDTSGTKITYAYIDCAGSLDPAIAPARFTVTYTEFDNCSEGPRLNGDATMEHSLFHNVPALPSDAHADGAQVVCGNNVVIRHNTIIMDDPTESANAAIMIGTACGDVDNVLIDGNLLAGGGYVVHAGSAEGYPSNATRVQVTNNRISTQVHPAGGYFGPFTSTYEATMAGNVWHDGPKAGQPL